MLFSFYFSALRWDDFHSYQQLLKNHNLLYLAGYNHLEVAEVLLEKGADVNAQDKGGLIPLHNASSYGVSQLT